MSFFDLIYRKQKNKKTVELNTQKTDEFADKISLELKTSAVEAITQILEEKEGKYLKSILETSFFPLQSLVFVPSDFETAKSELDKIFDFIISSETTSKFSIFNCFICSRIEFLFSSVA